MELFDSLGAHEKELLSKHLELLLEANKKTNLTRIDSYQVGMLLHVEDSLIGLEEFSQAPEGLYGDLGSGGGFPGIPLAVVSGRKTVLIDARKKKMDIVAELVDELGLSAQISTYAGRAELLARKMPSEFSVLTARALAGLSVLMELASPLLKQGGWLICYKTQNVDAELEHALSVQRQTGMKLVSDRSVLLEGEFERRIFVFERSGHASVKLPRLEGAAQKNPL